MSNAQLDALLETIAKRIEETLPDAESARKAATIVRESKTSAQ